MVLPFLGKFVERALLPVLVYGQECPTDSPIWPDLPANRGVKASSDPDLNVQEFTLAKSCLGIGAQHLGKDAGICADLDIKNLCAASFFPVLYTENYLRE